MYVLRIILDFCCLSFVGILCVLLFFFLKCYKVFFFNFLIIKKELMYIKSVYNYIYV